MFFLYTHTLNCSNAPTLSTEIFLCCSSSRRNLYWLQSCKTILVGNLSSRDLMCSPDNVWMFELLQQRDLSDGRARHAFLFTLQTDLLHGHHLACGLVPAFVNHSIGTCNNSGAHRSLSWEFIGYKTNKDSGHKWMMFQGGKKNNKPSPIFSIFR